MSNNGIRAISYELGSENLTYDDIAARFGEASAAKVLKGSGILNRRIAPPGVCGSDLAFAAAQRVLAAHPDLVPRIGVHIHCTQTPDYLLPTTACLLQDRLGLPQTAACFDLNLGCSQYVYALAVADSMLTAGLASHALVTTGDTMTQILNPRDRSLTPILGDAGSATLLEAGLSTGENAGFLGFEFGTDGSGAKHLMQSHGGARNPITPESSIEVTDADGNVRAPRDMFMNGAAVFHFAITVVPAIVKKLLTRLNLTMDDLDLVLLHQANRYMLDYLVKKLGVPPEKTFFFVEQIGNTSGSTMPVVISEAARAGKVRPGKLVLLCVFGVGLSWAATVFRVPESFSPADVL